MFVLLSLALFAAPALAGGSPWDDRLERSVRVDTERGTKKLARVQYEVPVDAPAEEVWALLADFGAVHRYFPAITDSAFVGSAGLEEGTARFCDINFSGRDVHVKERITEIEPSSWFTYDVYESVNFPLDAMFVSFGVRTDDVGQTWVYNIIDYRLKPAMMTPLFRGTMEDSAQNTVLGIKHVVEHDEVLYSDRLRELYPDL